MNPPACTSYYLNVWNVPLPKDPCEVCFHTRDCGIISAFRDGWPQYLSHYLHLLVYVGKARFITLGLGFPRAHGLEGFPDEIAVILARIAL